MLFTAATREKAKLRLALTGVSGSGKTLSALYLAYGVAGDWGKVAVIDTEHSRAKFYADRQDLNTGQFLHAELQPPYSVEKYKQYVEEAQKAVGADGVIVIDSFSHAWDGEGGVLECKDKIATQPGVNSYTAWNEAGRLQNDLVKAVLSANCHTIVTMRAKTKYTLVENERGRMQPVKMGFEPVQRENVDYEFDIVLWINREDHVAYTSKDTTFLGDYNAIITPEIGAKLRAWLDDAQEPPRCEVCNKLITPIKNKTIEAIASGTKELTQKQMCMACFKLWDKEMKANAATAGVST